MSLTCAKSVIVFLRRALSSLDLLVSLVIHQHLELAAALN